MNNTKPLASVCVYGGYSSTIHPVENSSVKSEMIPPIKVAVNNLSKYCSELTHIMIPVSATRESIDIDKICKKNSKELTGKDQSAIAARHNCHNQLIARNRSATPIFDGVPRMQIGSGDIDQPGYEAAKKNFINDLAEYVMLSLKSNTGNCLEKALVATIMFRLAFEKYLINHGFSKHEIDNANIRIAILTNNAAGGDHSVGSVKMTIGGVDEEFLIDPLMDGSVVEKSDIRQFYSKNESKYCSDKTAVFNDTHVFSEFINDSDFLELIKPRLEEMHRVDFDHFNPEAIIKQLHRVT
ncbi:hypothetical protein EO087_01405 [Dyella sp. M7H15-1]|uniref:hypothetical protein n=1 Tax=Dyella sp. M7H15-1 TaxID=2501295 RepID=UPI001004E964|nr:hypothetical protein [Dyella sp. M7H15-1]QAU22804.1 hypothetical protein EO087_01405 [Dyella sp. M7H15-1]